MNLSGFLGCLDNIKSSGSKIIKHISLNNKIYEWICLKYYHNTNFIII